MDNLVTKIDMIGTLELALHDNRLTNFNNIVTEKQEEYLKFLLGDYLYYLFVAAIDSVTPDQKWIDLRDGADFQVENKGETLTLKWKGLKNMLKYFMYYEYQVENVSKNTIASESKKKNVNSSFVNPSNKIVDKFNKGIELYGINTNKIRNSLVYDPLYSDITYTEWYYSHRESNNRVTRQKYEAAKIIPSAYNFISAKNNEIADTYPNWRFTELNTTNTFNLY